MFRLDKLTQKAQEAVQQTQALAEQNGSQVIFPLHLLIALTEEKEGIVRPVLEKCGVHPDAIVAEARRQLETVPKTSGMQVLSRRTKNNPVLIGEPGVGKTAIVEGLAQRIVRGDVPDQLKGKRLVAIDLGSMIAGTKFRGEFEDRLKAVVKEIIESNGEIICFIDELHTLVGAGSAEGAIDAANLLKPALARGELRCIGATTLNEYKKHVEK